jgi:hypothetical protein
MKILHITASYKPAYIYGGPVMSVAKLCEEIQAESPKSDDRSLKPVDWKLETEDKSLMTEDRGPQSGDRGREYEDGSLKIEVRRPMTEDRGPKPGDWKQLETDNWKLETDKTAVRSLAINN